MKVKGIAFLVALACLGQVAQAKVIMPPVAGATWSFMKKLSPPSRERFSEARMPPAAEVSSPRPSDMLTMDPASTLIPSRGASVTIAIE